MKKLLFILLSVVMMGVSACNSYHAGDKKNTGINDVMQSETENTSKEKEETSQKAGKTDDEGLKDTTESETETQKDQDTVSVEKTVTETDGSYQSSAAQETENAQNYVETRDIPAEADINPKNEPENEAQAKAQNRMEYNGGYQANQTDNVEVNTQTNVETKQVPQQENETISYDPDRVVSVAIDKCEAEGMITTEKNLQKCLTEGRITKEEYDEYYPLDGLEEGYYSVFVNVDLNRAATNSGRLLGSEEGIAQYIAGMLLLESEPIFNIRYTGIYKTSGDEFYEFRCYR